MTQPAALLDNPESAPTVEEVDRSFRLVAPFFAAKAGFWLVIGTLLSLLASVKLHGPGMMAGQAWLTYGRLLPAGWDVLVYGFAGQAGMAVGLWLVARSARQRLQAPLLVMAGGIIWNLGVLAGLIGILAGHSTGREWLEMPAGAMAMLVIGAGLIGTAGWITYAARTEPDPFPSAWFGLLALLAFVWFGSVALMMLSGEGPRGVLQVLVQRWFAGGVQKLWLGAIGLAVVFHFLPLRVGRPLASRQLTLVAFWSLVFFAPWAVTGHGDPFPRWIVSAGLAGQSLAMIGLTAVALNLWKTGEGAWSGLWSTTSGRLLGAAAIAQVSGGVLQYLISLRGPASVVRFTWMQQGLDWLLIGGGVGLALVAVLPEMLARCTGRTLAPGLVTAHAWLTLVGIALIALPLLLAGVLQGASLAGRAGTFMDSLTRSLHGVRLSSLGFTVLFLGQLAWVAALAGLFRGWMRECIATVQGWSVPVNVKSAGVRS